MIVHALICGRAGSGKSKSELRELNQTASQGDKAIILLDPHGLLAQEFLLHLSERNLLHRVIYDRLADTDRIPSFDWLVASQNSDPHQRYAENEDITRKFVALLVRRSGLKDTTQTPIIEKGLLDAVRLYMFQDQPTPIHWLAQLYTPNSPVFDHMVKHCTDEDSRLQMEQLLFANAHTRNFLTGPADRRLRAIFMSPAFALRCSGASFDFDSFLEHKGILLLDGEGCNPDATSIMMSAITLKTIDFCKRKKVFPVQITMDEATNASLIGLQESQALAEVRKWKLQFRILVQILNFAMPEITENVLQNCNLHRWFAQASPDAAELAAKDIATRILDPLKIHHIEYKVRNVDDGFERIANGSSSITKDSKGKKISQSASDNYSLVRKTKEVIDEKAHHMGLKDQIIIVQQKLMGLGDGWRWDSGNLEPHYEPMEKHLWHHLTGILSGPIPEEAIAELKQQKLQRAIAKVKESATYRAPILTPPPSAPPTPTKAGAAQRLKDKRGTK